MPAPSSSSRRSAERAGRLAEEVAALTLLVKGYRILARRFRTHLGEIDLVCRKGGTLIFVEVKYRSNLEAARLAVGHTGQKRIRAAAGSWLGQRTRRMDHPIRYDIIAVCPRGLRHIKDAFR